MAQSATEIGQTLDSMRDVLAQAIVDRCFTLHPELDVRYGQHGRQKCREDATFHLRYLAQAMTSSMPSLYCEYVGWAKVMLAGRGISPNDLSQNLQVTASILKDRLSPDDAPVACHYIESAIADLPRMADSLPSLISQNQPLAELAEAYLAALLACERQTASRLILDAVKNGTSIKDIYINVFQRTQHEIGRLWQVNRVSVAQEHYCTAVTQMVMSQLYPQIFSGPRIGRRFVGAAVGGDLHELGIRMISDFFELDGWDTVFLGSSVPGPDLIRTLEDRKPDVIGISATITPHIKGVAKLISDIRATPSCRNMKILVGGLPFCHAPNLWKELNADGTCLDARGAVELATHLIQK